MERSYMLETRVLDMRTPAARVLWNNGWGRQRFPSFQAYMQTIPPIPYGVYSFAHVRPVLIDMAVPLTAACRLLGIHYQGDDTIFAPLELPRHNPEVYWTWVRPGDKDTRLTAYEGVLAYAQYPELLAPGQVRLAGSRICSYPAYNACLLLHDGQPTLGVVEV